jgi:endonuclease VIII
MPEGDSIFRVAARLRIAVAGRAVTGAESRATGTFAPLVGDTLTSVETHGKNLFFVFGSGLVVHSHLRMHGSWRVVVHEKDRVPHHFRALLTFGDRSIVCVGAPVVRLLSAREAARARTSQAIGPDPLHDTFDVAAVVRALQKRAEPIGEILLDQRVIAGVGNILKSESLFVARQDPFASCASCTEEALVRVVETARDLLRASVAKKGNASIHDDTAPFRTKSRVTKGDFDPWLGPSPSETNWVYRRSGEPCHSCKTPIGMRHQGSPPRSTYFCPRCQESLESAPPRPKRTT